MDILNFLHGDLADLVKTIGYIGLFFMVFAESGLFFGFFFPGDSLLFTAGFLASQGLFNIAVLVPLMVLAAVGGDSAGYWTGKKFGGWLLTRKSSLFFSKENLEKAQKFFDENGGKALILARFMPAVRTFVPIAAGMAGMEYKKFISYNVVGGLIWGAGMTLGGYFLGQLIPDVDKYLLPIILLIIILSVLPGLIHMRGDIKKIIVKLLSKLP
jgi:membrane-associated protein